MNSANNTDNLSLWTHSHVFEDGSEAAERDARIVIWITAAMMVVEIAHDGYIGNKFRERVGRRTVISHLLPCHLCAAKAASDRRCCGQS